MTAAVGRTHRYEISLTWTGNRGTGTSGYRAYGRSHDVRADGLPPIAGSSDRAFHGDRDRWNPELELTAALSQCHLLSDYDGESRYDRQPVGTPPEHAFSGAVARLCAVLREAARGADPHPWHSMVIGP